MRLFVALELPDRARAALAALENRLMQHWGDWRWVRPESIHLTLRFLGDVDPERDSRARPAWRGAAASLDRFAFRLRGLGMFPDSRRARVLWVGVAEEPEGAMARLAESLDRAATGAGLPPEPRPFRPHLTLARRQRPGSRSGLVDLPDFDFPERDCDEPIVAREIVLFESHLGPAGARHTALERFPLGRSNDRNEG